MTVTQLQLYNGALRLCKERSLATLSENREPRRLLDAVWADDAVKLWLEAGQWQFATKSVKIDYDTGVTPSFGYSRAFARPDDYVRTVAISANEYFDPVLTAYRDEAGYIYADLDEIYLAYVSDAADYGRDMSLWPPSFVRFAQADLAAEINPRLTGSTVSTKELMELREKRLSEAQGKDGVNRPTQFASQGSWVSARVGRARSDNRRSGR